MMQPTWQEKQQLLPESDSGEESNDPNEKSQRSFGYCSTFLKRLTWIMMMIILILNIPEHSEIYQSTRHKFVKFFIRIMSLF